MTQHAHGTFQAIRLTPAFAIGTGWPQHFRPLSAVLGFPTSYPGVKDFVRAVQLWQSRHPGLRADGIIGPKTWKLLEPVVKGFTGPMPKGEYPDWVLRMALFIAERSIEGMERNVRDILVWQAQRVRHVPPPCRTPRSAEDELFQEMAQVAVQQRKNPGHALEVSAAYAQHAAKHSLKSVQTRADLTPWGSILGTLALGQVWPGVKGGTRIIVALQASFDVKAQGESCEIVFVTDSGRVYAQPLSGWAHDYGTVIIDNVNRKLAPLKVMLDVEVAFMLASISTINVWVAGYVTAATFLNWWMDPKSKETISTIINGLGLFLIVREELLRLAPRLYDKVFVACVGNFLRELPAGAKDPKALASFAGSVIWTLGRAAITHEFAAGATALTLLKQIASRLLRTTALPAAVVLAKAVPAAAKATAHKAPGIAANAAAEELIKALGGVGVVVAVADAVQILREIEQNPQLVQKALDRMAKALDLLIAAVAKVG